MIKLQVLRYMGILTVMKLSVFAVSAVSLLLACAWFLIYCPVGVHKSTINVNHLDNVHNPKNLKLKDYFDHYEAELENEINAEKSGKPNKIVHDSHNLDAKDSSKQTNSANVIPVEKYTDEAFERMIRELNHKDTTGYEFMAESTNVTIYKKPQGNAGLFKYKLYAILPHATPEEIAAVFLDNEYRLVWDDYVTELYPVQLNEKGPDVIYFNVDYPWPLANRDYVYARETRKQIRDGKEYITIVMHSVLEDNIPLVSGVIRVTDYHQSLAMTKFGKTGTTALIEYYDDPKGAVPTWLVNWAAKTGVPAFLNDLQRACAGLHGYLKKKNKPMLTIAVH